MKLKKLALENIRSYKKTEIEFPLGRILFEGDIGSGKSTLLYAIEFALFGLGDLKDIGLLRVGEKEGKVLLNFEVDGKDYKVERKLIKKGDSAVVGECYLIENNTKLPLTTSELKKRVLQILNINEKDNPNASSVIYRYAVFTPQEKMREILFQKRDERIETLRRAFGIEEYSIAVRNANFLRIAIEKEIELKKGQIENLDKDKEELAEKEKSLEENLKIKEKVILTWKEIEEKISKAREEEDKLRKEKESCIKLEKDIEEIRKNIIKENDEKNDFIEKNKNLLERIKAKEKSIEDFSKIKIPTEETEEELNRKISNLKEKKEVEQKKLTEIEKICFGSDKEIEAIEKERSYKSSDMENTREKIKKLSEEVRLRRLRLEGLVVKIPTEKSEEELEAKDEEIGKVLKEKEKEHTLAEDEFKKLYFVYKEKKCPTCGGDIVPEKFSERMKILKEKIKKLNEEIEIAKSEKEASKKLVKELRECLKKKEEKERVEKELKEKEDLQLELNEKISSLHKEIKELIDKSVKKKEEKKLAEKEMKGQREILDNIKKELSSIEKIENELKNYLRKKEQIKGIENEKKNFEEQKINNEEKIKKIEEEISSLRRNLEVKEKEIEKYKELDLNIANAKLKREEIEKDRDKIIKEISSLQQKIKDNEEEITNIKIKIKDKEEKKEKMVSFIEFKNYLQEFFIPTIAEIEKHVLAAINEEFNNLFQKWFSMLIEDADFTVKINGDFTPIIEQGQYELGIEGLSGGEKTSVALSYRLALNILVKKICSAMKSNLLILDEPTDGFSKEQLTKVRDVLNVLNAEQLIIVSHEKELEGFVDKIFKVKKEGNVSRIES